MTRQPLRCKNTYAYAKQKTLKQLIICFSQGKKNYFRDGNLIPIMAFLETTQNTSLDAVWYNGELLWEYKGGTWQPRWLDAAAVMASPKWIIEWQGGDANKPLYIIICKCFNLSPKEYVTV